MLKKIGLIIMLLSVSNAYAMDELSSIPDSHKHILSQIQEQFKIKTLSKKTKIAIYHKFNFALENKWNSFWVGNSDLGLSKFKNSKVQVFELIVPNNNRIYIISFTYFPKAKQIFCSTKQFIESDSGCIQLV